MAAAILCLRECRGKSTAPGTERVELAVAAAQSGDFALDGLPGCYISRGFVEREQSWLTVVRLPAYAPELNSVEGSWSWFKRTVVGNFCPDGLGPLHRVLRFARRRLIRQHPTLIGFLHKSGLHLDLTITLLRETL